MITFGDAYRGWLAVRYPDRAFSPAVQVLIAQLNDAVQQNNISDINQFVVRLELISGYLDTWGEREFASVELARAAYEVQLLIPAERFLRQAAVQCMHDRPCYAMVHFLLGVVLCDLGLYQDASRAWSASRQTLSLLTKSHSQYTPRTGWYKEIMNAIPRLVAQNLIEFEGELPERIDGEEWPFTSDPVEGPVAPFYENLRFNLPR